MAAAGRSPVRREVPQAILDPEGVWQDPDGALSHSLALEPAAALWQLSDSPPTADPDWLAGWLPAGAAG